jgi:short subunit dehydrogenase-like uncharacterized protein
MTDRADALALAARTGGHHFDATCERFFVERAFAMYGDVAKASGACIVPATGYVGALADWLAQRAMARLGVEVESLAVCYVDGGVRSALPARDTRSFAVTGERGALHERTAVSCEGPEGILLRSHTNVQTVRTFQVVPSWRQVVSRLGGSGSLARAIRGEATGVGETDAFEVIVEAARGGVSALARARGKGTQRVTAEIQTFAAAEALAGRVTAKGVVAPSVAFDAERAIAALEEHGVRFTMTERSREV